LVLLSVCPARAEPVRSDQLREIDTFVNDSLAMLQHDADKNIDTALDALADAYKGSVYAGHSDTEAVRHRLIEAGSKLKGDVAALQTEVKAMDRSRRVASVVILSKAQATNIKITRWLWRVTEISDLALANARRDGGDASKFLTSLMETHDALQDTTEQAIQLLASNLAEGR
jgi:hypothetical protein